MSSTIAWLDHSETQRRQMLDIIALFRDQGTVDELGLGSIRDAFADMLFPGTSTIQTRARYFLFVPWIYLGLEARKVPSHRVGDRARNRELALIETLRTNEIARGNTRLEGLIGSSAGRDLKRLPSEIYWNGMRIWGIRTFSGSREQYHNSLDAFYEQQRAARATGQEEVSERSPTNWHAGLPPASDSFPDDAVLALTAAEAEYLRDRIALTTPTTLLAWLVGNGKPAKTDFVWQHPQLGEFPDRIQEQIEHGRNFSDAVWGAQVFYNLEMAQQAGRDDLVDRYESMFSEWEELVASRPDLRDWKRSSFWALVVVKNPRLPVRTRRFVDDWLDLALQDTRRDKKKRDLIVRRELQLKRRRARLTHRDALERWGGDSGSEQLDLRWTSAQTHTNDILTGLNEIAGANA